MIDHRHFLSSAAAAYQESAIRKTGALAAQVPDLISFAAGNPSSATLPWAELEAIASELLSKRDGRVLQYRATRGYRPLVEQVITTLTDQGKSVG